MSTAPLHTLEPLPHTLLNRAFALVYSCGILALVYHHSLTLFRCTAPTTISSYTCFFLHLSLLLADVSLAFMWVTTQSFRMNPVRRSAYPERLRMGEVESSDYPGLDVFICTADPYKEPPINVVNTALSVMAYDYPTDKISVYVSDDGGSQLTLFAFMEAAKFARYWLPYCRDNNLVNRCPEAYFSSSYTPDNVKIMYETMKMKIESAVERGCMNEEHIETEHESQVLSKWTQGFTRHDHPPIIQVLVENIKNKDVKGHDMPNLVYVSREKRKTSPHHFKAGALNTLLRVSATMTNAPIVLTQDCDMYSNDPCSPLRALCYLMDPSVKSDLGYVQFPQRFHGINKTDIYAGEHKRLYQINPVGMDGLAGTTYVGSGCFFNRRAFFGDPSCLLPTEIPELSPHYVVDKLINSASVLAVAHRVASCTYEQATNWGSKMGFRYGSLSEDFHTGYWQQCQGWKSVFCHPDCPAFLGDVPITFNDVLSQNKRWAVGLLQVAFSKCSPVTFGIKRMGLLMGLSYAHNAFWPIWSIPITIYAFIPQLALLHGVSILPKVTTPWFPIYMFLFLGAYAQDLFDFAYAGGTINQWWNDQRMWMTRGVTSYLFGFIDYVFQVVGVAAFGFNVTSKVVDNEQSKRYEQGIFEFQVESPFFTMLALTAIINLVAFVSGVAGVFRHGDLDEMLGQLFLSGFVVVNCWPIYEAMLLRTDKGRLPRKTTVTSMILAWVLYLLAHIVL